jgi:hypothetical protein
MDQHHRIGFMMNKLLTLVFLIGTYNTTMAEMVERTSEEEIVICQDQAENFGNGKGDDVISKKCMESFKSMATSEAVTTSKIMKMKFYGYRNMVLIEKYKKNSVVTEIIAGSSTELKSIRALAFDEKNQEVAVLEESGDVLFFSSKITGNISPFRILQDKELVGGSELVIDSLRDQVVVNNKTTKRILFFSRLANVHAREGKQKLGIIKTIDTSLRDLK